MVARGLTATRFVCINNTIMVENSTKGLPGLRIIREHLGLTQGGIGVSKGVYIGRLETGKTDCTQALQRQIASALCCEVIDLLGEPSPARLQEIRDAFELRNAQAVIARQAQREAAEQGVA
jgi:hypothetical protein